MSEIKKKIIIGVLICVIVGVGGVTYYFMQNSDEEFCDYEEDISTQNMDSFNNSINIENIQNDNEDKIVVHVAGQVINPGVFTLNKGARIIDAINVAGGATEEADLANVNLAYLIEDAQRIYIPSVNEKDNGSFTDNIGGQKEIVTNGSGNESNKEKIFVNINTASETELQKIPGIGQSIASKIIAYRKENGKFNTIEDIKKVSGIGTSKFNNIKNFICVK